MKKKTKYISSAILAIASIASISAPVMAATNTSVCSDSTKIAEIASRHGISKAQAKKECETKTKDMQKKFENQLAKLVSSKKITQAQSDAIKAKAPEVRDSIHTILGNPPTKSEMDSMTDAQRKASFDAKKVELDKLKASVEQWLTDQGISKDLINQLMPTPKGGGDKMRSGGPGHFGQKPPQNATSNK